MSHALNMFENRLVGETCITCGIEFGMPVEYVQQRKKEKSNYFCPNGHQQHYISKTEAELLKEELDKEKKRREWAEESRKNAWERVEEEKRSKAALKGVLTRTKNRVSKGVCPCCDRTFQNLMK